MTEDRPQQTGLKLFLNSLRRRYLIALLFFVGGAPIFIIVVLMKIESVLGRGLDEWEVPYQYTIESDRGYELAIYSNDSKGKNYELGILFIHGTPGSADNFKHQFHESWPHTVLVSYNRPGFWNSKSRVPVGSLKKQADAAFEVMEEFNVEKWILVGHSYGGPISLQMMTQRQEKILGNIQIGGALDPELEKIYWIQRIGNSILFNWMIPNSLNSSNKELIQLKKDLEKLRFSFKELKSPIVMLHGSDDRLVPVSNCKYIEKELQKISLNHLLHFDIKEGVDHFIPWSHPKFVKHSIDFLIGLSELELEQ